MHENTAKRASLIRRLAQRFGMALAVVALAYLADCLWLLGFAADAEPRSREARELAELVQQPMASCYAIARACWLAAMQSEIEAVGAYTEKLRQTAELYGFHNFVLAAQFFRHWTAVHANPPLPEDIEQMYQAMVAYRATGTTLNSTAFLVFFAEACGKAGQIARGLAAVEESLSLAEQTGEMWFQAAAWRVKGELLALQAGHGVAAETVPAAAACFEMARQVAAQQGVKSLPLWTSSIGVP